MVMNDLHTKYRPTTWDEVIGHENIVSSVQKVLKNKSGRAFIFNGPSGTGKTTFARLIARELGIDPESAAYREIDAGSNTGVDDVRALKQGLRLNALGGNGKRVVCLDEAHALSASAWKALLKDVEEPPSGLYWVFCTTEAGKIPVAIRNRCQDYTLRLLPRGDMKTLLNTTVKAEGIKIYDDDVDALLDYADGSPRALLTGLAKIADSDLKKSGVRELLQQMSKEQEGEIIDLCRALIKGTNWNEAIAILKRINKPNAFAIREVIIRYCTGTIMNGGGPVVRNASSVLYCFKDPFPVCKEGEIHPVLLCLADLLLGDKD